MASFFSSVRQGLGRQNNKVNTQPGRPGLQTPNSHSPASYQSPVHTQQQNPSNPHSPSIPTPMSAEDGQGPETQLANNNKPPFFFRAEYAILIVKGNFMTLAAKPEHVELGEWLAHQVVEQYRLLESMIQIIRAVDERTCMAICNQQTCPTMSAAGHTYTWLDSNKNPIRIPAFQYIQLVQKWILGKISDSALFPTDTSTYANPAVAAASAGTAVSNNAAPSSTAMTAAAPIPAGPTNLNASLSALSGRDWLGKASGFPENFEADIRSIYRQMMRCYAHLYHGHWLDPFWHLNAYKELNTCFIHFVSVGKLFGLLAEKEMEPMMPLIELWTAKGLLPDERQVQLAQQQQHQPQQSQSQQSQQSQQSSQQQQDSTPTNPFANGNNQGVHAGSGGGGSGG